MVEIPSGRERPAWGKMTSPNCRGRVDPGPRHYLALVTLQGAAVEGIVDTGACRTMMDIDTARALQLETEERDPDLPLRTAPFGTVTGPAGEVHPYDGRVVGAVAICFSPRVALRLPEIKLVRLREPLLLLGTDLLGPMREGWGFMHVGYDPYDLRGIIGFSKDRGADQEVVELVQAPGACIRGGEGDLQGFAGGYPRGWGGCCGR